MFEIYIKNKLEKWTSIEEIGIKIKATILSLCVQRIYKRILPNDCKFTLVYRNIHSHEF